MASFYELTKDQVKLLLEALEYFKTHQGTYGDKETQRYQDLKHYLEMQQRRGSEPESWRNPGTASQRI